MATKTPDLIEPETDAIAIPEAPAVAMFERLAKDPSVDVGKLERLIEMQERIMRHNAKAAFAAAFAKMQPAIPEISERGQIIVRGVLRSTFAPLEDIHKVIIPILSQHGFAIRHRTEWPDKPGIIRIVGILSHVEGHSEESTFEAPMDKSEFRSDIQSMGSTVSYGRRYTTLDLLNIVTRGQDKDGSQKDDKTAEPEGYETFIDNLTAVAEEGIGRLEATFKVCDVKHRNYLTNHHPQAWAALRQRARKADETQRGRR